jgi:tetratricopeptide (TPR) repeat protein
MKKNSTHRFLGRRKVTTGHGSRLIPRAITIIAILVLCVGMYFLINAKEMIQKESSSRVQAYSKTKILETWSSGDRAATLEMTRSSLEALPLDPFYLSFNGISAYYLSSEKPEGDERQNLLDEAVFSLRKAIASGGKLPVKAQVEYVLGKAYFQKGSPWYDLAARYLSQSKEDGYEGKDSEQYLGLSYAGLQDHDAAVMHFESALKLASSDILMLSAAISYKELGNMEKTKELLSNAVASASDALIIQKSRFMLGEMAMANGELAKAGEQYQSIVDMDPRSAEAWYRLGLVSEALKDSIKARAAWRKATSIDPNHIEARKKLADRL